MLKVLEAGRVVGVHALIASGVNVDGHRELLGLHVSSAEDGVGWLAFFRDLVARGLTGVALVTSDAHRGLVETAAAMLPGASWQWPSVNISGGGTFLAGLPPPPGEDLGSVTP